MLTAASSAQKELMDLARSKGKYHAKNSLRLLIQSKSARHKNNKSLKTSGSIPK